MNTENTGTKQTRKQFLEDQAYWNSPEGKHELEDIDRWLKDNSAREAEKQAKAKTWDPTEADPDIEALQKRLEQRRHAMWLAGNAGGRVESLASRPRINADGNIERGTTAEVIPGGWYGRNRADGREKFIDKLAQLELSSSSYISSIRQELKEEGWPVEKINALWQKLSIYGIMKDMLGHPKLSVQKETTIVEQERLNLVIPEGPVDENGYGPDMVKERIKFNTEITKVASNEHEVHGYKALHKLLDAHGGMDFLAKPPKMTLYVNPDGTKYLNKTQGDRSPIQAKIAFAKRQGVDDQKVMVERVTYMKGSKILKELNLPDKQTSMYVVSLRKRSDEAASSYYDPNPQMVDQVNKEGEWENIYRWQSGKLTRIPANMVIPKGGKKLTVREFEMAILAGAEIEEDEAETIANSFAHKDEDNDDRLKHPDGLPRKATNKLLEDEQSFYQALIALEEYDLAEMMTVDFESNVSKNAQAAEEIAAQIFNTLTPSHTNPKWVELADKLIEINLENQTLSAPPRRAESLRGVEMTKQEAEEERAIATMNSKTEARDRAMQITSATLSAIESFIFSLQK